MLDLLGGLDTIGGSVPKDRSGIPHFTHVVGLFLALLGTTAETEDQVESGLLLNVVVAKSAAILQLLSSKD